MYLITSQVQPKPYYASPLRNPEAKQAAQPASKLEIKQACTQYDLKQKLPAALVGEYHWNVHTSVLQWN